MNIKTLKILLTTAESIIGEDADVVIDTEAHHFNTHLADVIDSGIITKSSGLKERFIIHPELT